MSRKKKKRAKQVATKTDSQTMVVIPDDFDYQKFADAMVEAQRRAKEIEKCEAEKEIQEKQAEWKKILGHKEYPVSRCKLVNKFFSSLNGVKVFWKIITFKKKDAKFDVATVTLLRFSIYAILWLIKITLYFVTVVFGIASFYSFSEKTFIPFNLSCLLMSFVPFVLARIVRMAQFEIEYIKDRNYLIGILSSTTAFIAMVIAIIALVV